MDNMITDDRLINQRTIWAAKRFWMEAENMKSKRYGGKSHHHQYLLMFFLRAFRVLLKLVGEYKEGFDNTENIVLRELELKFPDLPSKFESFTILHLSDIHFGCIPGIEDIILKQLNNREVDICVITGDYLKRNSCPDKQCYREPQKDNRRYQYSSRISRNTW